MDSARFRTRAAALVALGAFVFAAVLVGGCAAPDRDDRATFGAVTGVVQDTDGNPIPGAIVRVVQPTPGADIVPATVTTGPDGVFVASVQVGRTVQIEATAPGFITGFGRRADAGARATVFTVADTGVTRVTIVLQTDAEAGGATAVIGAAGGSVGSVAANGFRVSLPAGALQGETQIRVFRLLGSNVPLPPNPALHRQVSPGTLDIAAPVAAVRIEPADLALSGPASVTVALPAGLPATGTLPLWWLDPATNQWLDAGFATLGSSGGQPTATFTTLAPAGPGGSSVPRLGSYMVTVATQWTFGTAQAVPLAEAQSVFGDLVQGAVEVNGTTQATMPPLTSGQGYSVALPVRLTGFSAGDFLTQTFEAIAGEVANGFVLEAVPGGGNIGLVSTLQSQTVSVTSSVGSRSGTRHFWTSTQVQNVAPVDVVPPHFQGHGQGGGTGG